MPPISAPNTGVDPSIRVSDILIKFIQKSENGNQPRQAEVACIREIARHVLLLNRDLLDIAVPRDHEPEITKGLVDFLSNEFLETLSEVQTRAAEQSRTVTEADIVKAVSDERVFKLAQEFRHNVFEAVRQDK